MTAPRCENCPCPHNCRAIPAYCRWAAESPQDPVKIRHIVDVSAKHEAFRENRPEAAQPAADRTAPGPAEYPGLFRQAKNLAGAAVQFARSGFKLARKETIARRRATCAACPHWVAERKRCKLCGCRTEAKIHGAIYQCPDDPPRWLAEDADEAAPIDSPPTSPAAPE